MSIELNIYLLFWYFQQNQCLSINKHALHNIHRLAWDPSYARGIPGNCPACPFSKTALIFSTYYMYAISYRRQCPNDIENLSTSSWNTESSQRSTTKIHRASLSSW